MFNQSSYAYLVSTAVMRIYVNLMRRGKYKVLNRDNEDLIAKMESNLI